METTLSSWHTTLELRERTVQLLEHVASGAVIAAEDVEAAAQLLADLRAVWTREKRWRNDRPAQALVHTAGPVIASREYRRSCPGYIVDQRQACAECGAELVRGRWAMFFTPGDRVAQLGTITYPPSGHPRETDCTAT